MAGTQRSRGLRCRVWNGRSCYDVVRPSELHQSCHLSALCSSLDADHRAGLTKAASTHMLHAQCHGPGSGCSPGQVCQ